MIETDPYGKFIPGPNGLPSTGTTGGFVEGNLGDPVPVPADAVRIGTAFLNDIAHSASPLTGPRLHRTPTPWPSKAWRHTVAGRRLRQRAARPPRDLRRRRCNENIALQAVHQVFHAEHDRLIGDIQNTLTTDTTAEWRRASGRVEAGPGAAGWNGERLFQAARFVTEMQYQHLVFEEFARKVQPGINPFEPSFTQTTSTPPSPPSSPTPSTGSATRC